LHRKIKLIWDFRGPESLKIAEHHCVHLNEFVITEALTFHEIDVVEISDYYSTAFIVISEKDMLTFRDALKPHRGEIAK
jgi:hypothetical protein